MDGIEPHGGHRGGLFDFAGLLFAERFVFQQGGKLAGIDGGGLGEECLPAAAAFVYPLPQVGAAQFGDVHESLLNSMEAALYAFIYRQVNILPICSRKNVFQTASSSRMVLGDNIFQPFVGDMGVDLGDTDVGMAEQALNDAQIRAVIDQMGGKGMAQAVRAEVADPPRAGPS